MVKGLPALGILRMIEPRAGLKGEVLARGCGFEWFPSEAIVHAKELGFLFLQQITTCLIELSRRSEGPALPFSVLVSIQKLLYQDVILLLL